MAPPFSKHVQNRMYMYRSATSNNVHFDPHEILSYHLGNTCMIYRYTHTHIRNQRLCLYFGIIVPHRFADEVSKLCIRYTVYQLKCMNSRRYTKCIRL
jgi:hypothetical protein